MRTAFLVLLAATLASAGEITLHEQALPEVKASIQLPEGWASVTESDEGVFVYHLQKGPRPAEQDPSAITLSVTTKVPERTTQSPSQYAAALIDMSQDDGPNSPIQKAEINGLPSLRSEYHFESDKGKMRAVNIALPNDKTGTLYFFAWQAPMDEPTAAEALRDKVVASLKIDPAF
ncbi:MAG: hypothetical protein WC003_11215 [Terrimicrobiaceae bacterium]